MQEQVIQLLDNLSIKHRWVTHPAVFTVADLAELNDGTKPVKNLLLQEDDGVRKFLVVMAGFQRLDLKNLRIKLGSRRLRFTSDETLQSTLGVKSGMVSIFGMMHNGSSDVEVVIDSQIVGNDDELGFHPNDNTVTIYFSAMNLERVLAEIGCKYKIMKLY